MKLKRQKNTSFNPPHPFHPLLISAYIPLFLYSQNIHRYSAEVALLPGLLIVGAVTILLVMLISVFRQKHLVSVWLSTNLLLFFGYGGLYRFLRAEFSNTFIGLLGQQKVILLLYGLINIFLLYKLWPAKNRLQGTTIVLNRISLILLLLPFFSITKFVFFENQGAVTENPSSMAPGTMAPPTPLPDKLPDVYHIIMDAYPRQDVLKDSYNFDNSEFIDFLKSQGFLVTDSSYANYTSTDLSLTSMLNMKYLQDMGFELNVNSKDYKTLDKMREQSEVFKFFKTMGYRFYHVTHGWENSISPLTDIIISPKSGEGKYYLNEFQNGLLEMTPLPYLFKRGGRRILDKNTQHRNRILFGFDFLEQASNESGPKFIFCHFMAPHGPIVLGPHGEPLNPQIHQKKLRNFNPRQFKSGIGDEITYLNHRLTKIITSILNSSDRETIILLHSDHGESTIDYTDNSNYYRQRHANLGAIFLPGGRQDSTFYPALSPVNYYRFIFKQAYNLDLKFIEDKVYYSSENRIYDFADVTGMLD